MTWLGRLLVVQRIVEHGWTVVTAAAASGISRTTAHKWLRRWRCEGEAGLEDRSSAPQRVWNRTPAARVERIEQLRRRRLTSRSIAGRLRMALSTVGGILRRLGLGSRRSLEPREEVVRYERERPGDLLHLDVKKLGRFWRPGHRVRGRGPGVSIGAGWEYVRVCIDDHSRVAYVEIADDERKETASGCLRRAVAWYLERGVTVREVLTDNGSCYRSKHFAAVCAELGIRHRFTRPYRPQTNGKAERLIRTLLEEWAYGRPYENSLARARALGPWLAHYNRRRPHGGIGYVPPMTRMPRQV
jgi:transposase InsO family protein